MRQEIIKNFEEVFGQGDGVRVFFSPGRVNLIGEHTDYNGGSVLPCAINLGTYGAIRKRDDNIIKLISGNFVGSYVEFTLDQLVFDDEHGWGNYPKGVVAQFVNAGYKIGGFELYVFGYLPNGAGLSSSASITTLVALALNNLFDLEVDPIMRVKFCQAAEVFNGVNCGIMDPFIITMGKRGHAMQLNCRTLEYSHIPLNLKEYNLVITNSNVKRGLASSKYNERRAECEQALADLQKFYYVKNLCDLLPRDFEKIMGRINEIDHRYRAAHVVYENDRVYRMADMLRAGNLGGLKDIMTDSHESLRAWYKVSGEYLDALVESALSYENIHPGNIGTVLGARMTGAGFGGCTVNIVQRDHTDTFKYHVGSEYRRITGKNASFYITEAAEGAAEI